MSRPWQAVMRDLLQMAKATHKEDYCACEEIFEEARRLLNGWPDEAESGS